MVARTRVVNRQNTRRGVLARRGDGTFGEIIPNTPALIEPGFRVARGEVATVELGIEVKILAKAMLKQIDRVIGDLNKQVSQFQLGGGSPVTIGIVGINHAAVYTSYEGDREYRTTGRDGYAHPIQEAKEAKRRLVTMAAPQFDQFLPLEFRAENVAPFRFEWLNKDSTERDYGAVLTRVLRSYDQRF